MVSTESMCEVVCGAFHEDSNRYDRSAKKAHMHAQMKAIGVKIVIITSDTLNVDHLKLRKKKQKNKQNHEQIEG